VRVLYPGGFDLLHQGHLAALTTARTLAGRYGHGHLIAAVNSDTLMAGYKRTPSRDQEQRAHDVRQLGIADEVIIWDGPEGQAEQILALHPDLYIAGTDWIAKDLAQQLRIPSLTWFDEHAISLLFLRRTQGISTTQLIEGTAWTPDTEAPTGPSAKGGLE
jgi:cytidyltransferase-like protein